MNYSYPLRDVQPTLDIRFLTGRRGDSPPCVLPYFRAQYPWRADLKILAVSDMVVDRLYSPTIAERFSGTKMIIGCGDLPYEYLEFLVSALNIPLLYVPGNHDPVYNPKEPSSFAQGGEYMDLKITRVNGLNIAGIGGSMKYSLSGENQYTQNQMYTRLAAFSPKLFWSLYRKGGQLDILIAHSPPQGIHDDNDLAHIGFSAFNDFIKFFEPRFFLHGHTLAYKDNISPQVTKLGKTTIINVNPYRILEV